MFYVRHAEFVALLWQYRKKRCTLLRYLQSFATLLQKIAAEVEEKTGSRATAITAKVSRTTV